MNSERIIDAIIEVFGVTKEKILSDDKKRNTVYARAVASMYLRMSGLSLRETGIMVGRDHSSISRYENQLIEVIVRDKQYNDKYEQVGKILMEDENT